MFGIHVFNHRQQCPPTTCPFSLLSDDQGKISLDNLRSAVKETKLKFSNQDLDEMMAEADLNGDGYVDKDEFVAIMMRTNLF